MQNVADKVDRPKKNDFQPVFLSAEEMQKMFEALRGTKLELPVLFRDYFMQVKEAQELNKKICGNCYNYEYDGFVFVDEMGERMRAGYLTSYFPKFLEQHGLRRMRFHDLRHRRWKQGLFCLKEAISQVDGFQTI